MEKLRSKGYRLLRKLSEGVSAKIYLCELRRQGSAVGSESMMACKVIDKKHGEPKFVAKFLPREIAILSELNNPHCVQVYSIMEIRNKCFVFMRYAENGDLLDFLSANGATEESHARMWIRQMMLALRYLNSIHVAHRDIKCENILITTNMNAKLADFGFARYWLDDKGREQMSETYCGSISYAAPEILAGQPYVPKFCDMWSMGVVFYIMTNMTKPFTKSKAGALLKQQLAKDYRFKPQAEKDLSSAAKTIIRRMLEPDTNQRATADYVLNSRWMQEDQLLLKLVPEDDFVEIKQSSLAPK
ncbi:hypothetical protein AAG570_003087 [Ranatra chinensis]|uniref:Protein kinase domain-containing protein n=1 Tax=Ranatra chinensis TaxID=642074 RepID=A0ABD0Y5U6_9HEMI